MSGKKENNFVKDGHMPAEESLFAAFEKPGYEFWKKMVETELQGAPFKKLCSNTYEGVAINPVYTKEQVSGEITGSFPGFSPFTRGIRPEGVGLRGWEICIDTDADSPEELAIRLKAEEQRAGVSFFVDWQRANLKEVEDVLAAFCVLQKGAAIHFDTGVGGGCTGEALSPINLLLGALKESELPPETFSCSLGFSPLLNSLHTGTDGCSPANVGQHLGDLIRKFSGEYPKFRVLAVDGRLVGNAGGSAVQQIAFILAQMVEYIRAILPTGASLRQIAKSMIVRTSTNNNFFVEIAAQRALRSTMTQVLSAFGMPQSEIVSESPPVHVFDSSWDKTICDNYVNILRSTSQTLAAAIGGANIITVHPYNRLSREQSDLSRRLARNTQYILQDEVGIHSVVDPAGGSYFVEQLTLEIAQASWAKFQTIEEKGGFYQALRDGFIQEDLDAVAIAKFKGIEERKDNLIGTSVFPNLKEPISDTACAQIREDFLACNRELRNLSKFSVRKFTPVRWAMKYEYLRLNALEYAKTHGHPPQVFLANMGPLRQHKARADFSQAFFEPAGFEVIATYSFSSAEEAAREAASSQALITVLCSTDETYAELVPQFVPALKSANPSMVVVLAGMPTEQVDSFRKCGIDEFIHIRANNYQVLESLQKKTGVLV